MKLNEIALNKLKLQIISERLKKEEKIYHSLEMEVRVHRVYAPVSCDSGNYTINNMCVMEIRDLSEEELLQACYVDMNDLRQQKKDLEDSLLKA